MNIGEIAKRSSIPAKTIRYYEDIGLVSPGRTANGYRDFNDLDFHRLQFLGRARTLGFSIEDCRTLLQLWQDKSRTSGDVKAVVSTHLTKIDKKIDDLQAIRGTLMKLFKNCAGDDRPECPILENLSSSA